MTWEAEWAAVGGVVAPGEGCEKGGKGEFIPAIVGSRPGYGGESIATMWKGVGISMANNFCQALYIPTSAACTCSSVEFIFPINKDATYD